MENILQSSIFNSQWKTFFNLQYSIVNGKHSSIFNRKTIFNNQSSIYKRGLRTSADVY